MYNNITRVHVNNVISNVPIEEIMVSVYDMIFCTAAVADRCIFKLTYSFQLHYGPGVNSVSNRNEYPETFWG
jgi:hypothetical protein